MGESGFSYWAEFGAAWAHLFDPNIVLLIAVGMFIGLVIGFLPGVGSLLALALLLPFTFGMTPFGVFALLLGMYAVATIASDLTAILFGVPGQPDSAALIMDGYPMAKRGEAERAMAACTVAGAFGGVLGAVVLALSVPIMRPLVLQVGPPEAFMLTMLGASIIGTVSGRSVARGLAMAGLGLLMAAMGPNAQTGIYRYTFGSLYLLDGVPLVPAAVGLFAIPEIIGLHRDRTTVAGKAPPDQSTAMQGVRDTIKHWGSLVRGSVIGVGFGMLPGVGGPVAQWAAYGSARIGSKHPEEFGRGAIEGVIAPGACNNSKEGGQLIPTLAFGIPGSAAMAVLLGAFLIAGLNPGPEMLTVNLDLTFFMVIVLVVGNLAGALVMFPLFKYVAKLTFARSDILFPLILALILVGGVASTGQTGDLVLVVLAGLAAFGARRGGWPVVPWLVGFVLGEKAEDQLALSMNIYDGIGWLLHPGVLMILAAILVSVYFGFRAQRRSRAADLEAASANDTSEFDEGPVSPRASVAGGLLLLGVCVLTFALAWSWPFAARVYPQFVSVATFLAVVVAMYRTRQEWLRPQTAATSPEGARPPSEGVSGTVPPSDRAAGTGGAPTWLGRLDLLDFVRAQSVSSAIAWIVGTAMLAKAVGFLVAISVVVFAYLWLVARVEALTSTAVAAMTVGAFYLLFIWALQIPLPPTLTGWS